MTKEKVAEALGVATHTIPPLVRSGLLKPLGHPGRYCVKHFSRDALAEKFASPECSIKWRRPFTGTGATRTPGSGHGRHNQHEDGRVCAAPLSVLPAS